MDAKDAAKITTEKVLEEALKQIEKEAKKGEDHIGFFWVSSEELGVKIGKELNKKGYKTAVSYDEGDCYLKIQW